MVGFKGIFYTDIDAGQFQRFSRLGMDRLHADVSQLDASRIAEYTKTAKSVNLTDFVMNIIPKTFSGAFAEGNILAILLVSILFGA